MYRINKVLHSNQKYHTWKAFKIVKIHTNTSVSSLTANSPKIQVTPSMGISVAADITTALSTKDNSASWPFSKQQHYIIKTPAYIISSYILITATYVLANFGMRYFTSGCTHMHLHFFFFVFVHYSQWND